MMEHFNNAFGLLVMLGIIALLAVVLLYLYQKKNLRQLPVQKMMEPSNEVVELNVNYLKEYLGQFRNDEPLLIHAITNKLERIKTDSDIKVLKAALEQLKVKNEYLEMVKDYEVKIHELNRQNADFQQNDTIKDLTFERDKQRLMNDIELQKNPPPPPPTPPPPKSKAEIKTENQKRKEAEEDKHDVIVQGWRKELLNNPNFANEDIETEIERRKRARGWLDSI